MSLSQSQFNTLVDEHGPALYRIAYRLTGNRHEAEDIVQETFRSAWSSRARYEAGRGDRAWLASILRRRVVDRWRKRNSWHELPMEAAFEPAVETISAQNVELGDEMQAALSRLPTELRETLLLVVVGELTHQETADLLNTPLGTILSRVSRARSRLREILLSDKLQTTTNKPAG